MIKKQLAHAKKKIIAQVALVFGMERRQNNKKREFLEKLVVGEADRQQTLIAATLCLSRLREIYLNCGVDELLEIINEPKKQERTITREAHK